MANRKNSIGEILMEKKVSIEMNMNQAKLLIRALDLYSRIGIGQIEEIENLFRFHYSDEEYYNSEKSMEIERLLHEVKFEMFGLASNASYGITNDKVPDDFKVAYDMIKSLQRPIAIEENHHDFSVWRDGNILHLGSEEFIKVKVE